MDYRTAPVSKQRAPHGSRSERWGTDPTVDGRSRHTGTRTAPGLPLTSSSDFVGRVASPLVGDERSSPPSCATALEQCAATVSGVPLHGSAGGRWFAQRHARDGPAYYTKTPGTLPVASCVPSSL